MVKYGGPFFGLAVMLNILYGEDDFSRHEALLAIKRQLGDPTMLESNTTVLEGKQLTIQRLREVCHALPFFGDHRLVIVEGLLERYEPKPQKGPEKPAEKTRDREFAAALLELIPGMPPSTMLVVVDGGINLKRTNPLLKSLTPLAKSVKAFPRLKGTRLEDWVQERIASRGSKISPTALSLLVEMIGSDLWAAANEVEKLILYAAGPSITEGDVKECLSLTQESNRFAFMDAIMARQTGKAQELLQVLLDHGSKAPEVLAFIVQELSLVLRAAESLQQGLRPQQAQARLGISSDWRAQKIVRHGEQHGLPALKEMYHLLVEADMAVKTGLLDEDLSLNILVTELCHV